MSGSNWLPVSDAPLSMPSSLMLTNYRTPFLFLSLWFDLFFSFFLSCNSLFLFLSLWYLSFSLSFLSVRYIGNSDKVHKDDDSSFSSEHAFCVLTSLPLRSICYPSLRVPRQLKDPSSDLRIRKSEIDQILETRQQIDQREIDRQHHRDDETEKEWWDAIIEGQIGHATSPWVDGLRFSRHFLHLPRSPRAVTQRDREKEVEETRERERESHRREMSGGEINCRVLIGGPRYHRQIKGPDASSEI